MKKKKETLKLIDDANNKLDKINMSYESGNLYSFDDCTYDVLGNFLLYPKAEIKSLNKNGYEYLIEIVAIVDNKLKETHIVKATEIESPRFLSKYWGGTLAIDSRFGNYNKIKFALKTLLSSAKKKTQMNELGWAEPIKENYGYVYAKGIIGINDKKFIVGKHLSDYDIPKSNTSESDAYLGFLKQFEMASSHITYPMVSHSLSGILFPLFKEANNAIDYVLMISGRTGSLKTTISNIACNMFKDNNIIKHASFTDTLTDIEMFLYEMNSSTAIIDDLHPCISTTLANDQSHKVQSVTRLVGNCIGKGRSSPSLDRKQKYPPRSSVMFTGETSVSIESSLARIYTINMDREDINFKELNEIQDNEILISTCMYHFISWLAPRYKKIVSYIKERVKPLKLEFFNELSNHDFHFRKANVYVTMTISIEIFMKYGLEIGVIEKKAADRYIKNIKTLVKKGIENQVSEISENDPVKMYVFCKYFFQKVANTFSIVLQLEFPQCCTADFHTHLSMEISSMQAIF